MRQARTVVPSLPLLRYLARIHTRDRLPHRWFHDRSFSHGSRRKLQQSMTNLGNLPQIRPCSHELSHRAITQIPGLRRLRDPHALSRRTYSSAPPPPDTTSYYSLFPETLQSGSPPNGPFLVDARQLRNEYLRLQSLHHPDKYPSDQKRQADALSSMLGEAFRTLTDPLRCAQYLLLTKYDIDMNSESAKSSATDMEMLSTIMEAQEAASDASTQAEVDSLNAENERRIQDCVASLTEAFRVDDRDRARAECTQLKYWTSLRDALRNWEPGKEVRLEH